MHGKTRKQTEAEEGMPSSQLWALGLDSLPGRCPAEGAGKAAKVSELLSASRNQRKQSLQGTFQLCSPNQKCSEASFCLWRSKRVAISGWSGQNECDGEQRDLQAPFCGAWRCGGAVVQPGWHLLCVTSLAGNGRRSHPQGPCCYMHHPNSDCFVLFLPLRFTKHCLHFYCQDMK